MGHNIEDGDHRVGIPVTNSDIASLLFRAAGFATVLPPAADFVQTDIDDFKQTHGVSCVEVSLKSTFEDTAEPSGIGHYFLTIEL